jgi:hypothetical protein
MLERYPELCGQDMCIDLHGLLIVCGQLRIRLKAICFALFASIAVERTVLRFLIFANG